MAATLDKIDRFIDDSADFAKPILKHLRKLIHKACPDVVEKWKWSFPNFDYSGRPLCSMAAFKQHCSFGFWLGSLLKDPHKLLHIGSEKNGMGHFGQIKSINDLPSDKILMEYIREAMELNDQGVKLKKKPTSPAKLPEAPPEFLAMLKKQKQAWETFENFSPSHKKEYIMWITEAKTEATREKRMTQAIEMLAEGKSRNWK